jgi:peptidoglycan/xylan/chitin deacetylase (PgdA/CDA1 family)
MMFSAASGTIWLYERAEKPIVQLLAPNYHFSMTQNLVFLFTAAFITAGCTHSDLKTEARTPAAASRECDEEPCTGSPHAHWVTGLRNENVTQFGLANQNPPTMTLALTFDDGPGDGTTRLLELLDQYDIEAAYFHIGQNVKDHPRLFNAIHSKRNADGSPKHIIGNHSYTHPDLQTGVYTADNEALYRQLVRTDLIIKHAMPDGDYFDQSGNGVVYFRAPYGSWNAKDARQMRQKLAQYSSEGAEDIRHHYYGPIYWDLGGGIQCANRNPNTAANADPCEGQVLTDAADWDCWDRHISVERCAEGYFNRAMTVKGGVVLSHEIYKKTAQMWEILIPRLKAAGFKFQRLDKVASISRVKVPKAFQGDK